MGKTSPEVDAYISGAAAFAQPVLRKVRAAFHKGCQDPFEGFSPSHRREYVEWITEAKQEATRERRIASAIEWLTEGKSRNWKYEKC